MSGKQFSLDSRMDIVSTMASSAEGEAAGEHQTSENGKNRGHSGRGGGGGACEWTTDARHRGTLSDDVLCDLDDAIITCCGMDTLQHTVHWLS